MQTVTPGASHLEVTPIAYASGQSRAAARL